MLRSVMRAGARLFGGTDEPERNRALAEALARLHLWGPQGARCAIRANFRCEYCGRDLLASLDDYKAWAQDHIVPRKHGGSDRDSNMAVACHPCNSAYKKTWNPRAAVGAKASRTQLIQATRTMIAGKREAEQAVLGEVRRLARRHGLRR